MHILLVEDDSAITMGLDYTLKKEGYAVCICMSVEQARDALSKQRFDLALIDLSLPDGSGFDLCGSGSRARRGRHLPDGI